MTSVEYKTPGEPCNDMGEDPADRETYLRFVADALDAAYWQKHIEDQPVIE